MQDRRHREKAPGMKKGEAAGKKRGGAGVVSEAADKRQALNVLLSTQLLSVVTPNSLSKSSSSINFYQNIGEIKYINQLIRLFLSIRYEIWYAVRSITD